MTDDDHAREIDLADLPSSQVTKQNYHAWIAAQLAREREQWAARNGPASRSDRQGLAERSPQHGPTSVLSVRLDNGEYAALARRAELIGIRPAQLARNLIRVGLASYGSATISGAVDQVEKAVAELRAVVP